MLIGWLSGGGSTEVLDEAVQRQLSHCEATICGKGNELAISRDLACILLLVRLTVLSVNPFVQSSYESYMEILWDVGPNCTVELRFMLSLMWPQAIPSIFGRCPVRFF